MGWVISNSSSKGGGGRSMSNDTRYHPWKFQTSLAKVRQAQMTWWKSWLMFSKQWEWELNPLSVTLGNVFHPADSVFHICTWKRWIYNQLWLLMFNGGKTACILLIAARQPFLEQNCVLGVKTLNMCITLGPWFHFIFSDIVKCMLSGILFETS